MRFAPACAALLGILSGTCAPPPVPVRELRLTDQRFTEDTLFEVDRLVLTAGAHVHIERGALLMIRTRELVIEGPALLDADGTAGAELEMWTSQYPGVNCERLHMNWVLGSVAEERHRGNPGGPGGHIELRYHRVTEAGGALSDVRFTAQAGPASEGRRWRCGCYWLEREHAAHIEVGPHGYDGSPGSWRLIYEPELP